MRKSSGTIIDGPKAMQTSQTRLAAEAVAANASYTVQQAVQDAVAGSVAEAGAGMATLTREDAWGWMRHSDTNLNLPVHSYMGSGGP